MMQIGYSFSLGNEPENHERQISISGYRPWLVIVSVGFLLTIALPVAIFFFLVPVPILVASALYLVGLLTTILVTSGAERTLTLWAVRILLPLPVAGLVWWGLAAMGL